jgi:hypothetical protein
MEKEGKIRVLSVDLAYKSYANFKALSPKNLDLTGTPSPKELATKLAYACRQLSASTLSLDGPQGWKHSNNGLEHSRICERELNTQGKTGLPGSAKPLNYLPFIAFSIDVFQALLDHGFELWAGKASSAHFHAVESFPRSAWLHLGLNPLPAKSKTRNDHLHRATSDLRRLFPLDVPDGLSHDETASSSCFISRRGTGKRLPRWLCYRWY